MDQSISFRSVDVPKATYFPNPADKTLYFTSEDGSSNKSIELYTIDGKKVYGEYNLLPTNNTDIDVSSLNNGVYLVVISNDGEQVVKRILVQD